MDGVLAGVLSREQWEARRDAHERRVDAWTTPHLARRRSGITHPVEDFLFTYYAHSPAALRRWHPGHSVRLCGAVAAYDGRTGYLIDGDIAQVDPTLSAARRESVRRISHLLSAVANRPAQLGCFGLHEWAMVYQQSPHDLRHAAYPLRLSRQATDDVVESHRITCTHFDAFRFFTPPARSFNAEQPTRETQPAHDQPGCLHAAMDLYKWAYTLSPLTSSELVADCFALARAVRWVDMQAAPYDLSSLGVEPIAIETAEGKATYIAHQRDFAARSNTLRERLLNVCDVIIAVDA